MIIVPFAPDHLKFFATVTLHKQPFKSEQVRDWLTRLVKTVDMQELMPAEALECDDLGNEGVSGIVMLKTSHSSIHIWDRTELPYAKMMLYSCKAFNIEPILAMFVELGARVCRWELRDCNHQNEDELLKGNMYQLLAQGTRDYRNPID